MNKIKGIPNKDNCIQNLQPQHSLWLQLFQALQLAQ